MKQIYKLIAIGALVFGTSCIENDFPVRIVEGNIDQIELEGQLENGVVIDNVNYTVKVKVNDAVDVKNLQIRKLTVTNDASIQLVGYPKFPAEEFTSLENLPDSASTYVNFEKTANFVLTTYQEYKWRVSVEQIFDRFISVTNQFGDAVVDADNHSVVIYVTKEQDLSKIEVKELNLGGTTGVVTPNPTTVKDFNRPQEFTVTVHGESSLWTVSILHTEETEVSGDVSVWATKAYLKGNIQEGTNPVIEYRKRAESNWIELSATAITTTGGTYQAVISGLQPATTYSYRVTTGSVAGSAKEFTTESAPQIENLNFDSWAQGGKTWFPNVDASDSYWGTGNPGVTVVGKESNSIPVDDAVKGKAARLETVKVPLVGMAAGNLFTGGFKTNLSSPISSVRFGRHFTGRPSKLKGHYKYQGGVINTSDTDHKNEIGKPERFHIYISLEDWGSNVSKDKDGYEIRPENRTVIAYGGLISSESTNGYKEFSIDLDYAVQDKKPTHVVLVATSSIFGDYFTGYIGSTLWIDEFELVYE